MPKPGSLENSLQSTAHPLPRDARPGAFEGRGIVMSGGPMHVLQAGAQLLKLGLLPAAKLSPIFAEPGYG